MRIFLIGLPGSGKTYLGKLWAEDNGLLFYDLDELIEQEERMSVEKIFALNGEDYFREKEAAVLRNTDRFENCIVACGGGTPCFFDNAEWMNRNGVTVFLDEDRETILHHLLNDKKIRPLVQGKDAGELKQYLEFKYTERFPFFRRCQITLLPEQLNRTGFDHIINNNEQHA